VAGKSETEELNEVFNNQMILAFKIMSREEFNDLKVTFSYEREI